MMVPSSWRVRIPSPMEKHRHFIVGQGFGAKRERGGDRGFRSRFRIFPYRIKRDNRLAIPSPEWKVGDMFMHCGAERFEVLHVIGVHQQEAGQRNQFIVPGVTQPEVATDQAGFRQRHAGVVLDP